MPGTRQTNTFAEGLQKILQDIAILKVAPDADLNFIYNLESMIISQIRAPQDQLAQIQAQQAGQGGMPPMPQGAPQQGPPPMDPSMMQGAPQGMPPGQPPMDPSQLGPPPAPTGQQVPGMRQNPAIDPAMLAQLMASMPQQ